MSTTEQIRIANHLKECETCHRKQDKIARLTEQISAHEKYTEFKRYHCEEN